MDSQEFYDDLMNDVRTRAEIDNDFTQSAFLQETTERLVEAEEVGDLTPVNFTGTGIRGRRLTVSAYDEDASDDSIALAVVQLYYIVSPRLPGSWRPRRGGGPDD